MFGAQIITWASSFILMMFLPRYLGAEAYGRLYFAISLTALGGLFIDLGIGGFFVKEVARDRTKVNRFFMDSAGLRITAWLVVMAGMFLYSLATGYQAESMTILLVLGFGKLLESISDLAHKVFQSFERLSYRSVAVIVERVSLAAVAVAMLLMGFGTVAIALVMTFSVLLNFITCVILLPKLVRLKIQIQPTMWKPLLRGALPFLISTFFSFVYFRIDVLMLSAMAGDLVVGWYGAPYRLFDTLMFFPVILHMAMFPVLSRLWRESREGFVRTARQALNITIIVASAIAFLLVLLSRPIVEMLFGLGDYANSVILLQGLALCLPVVYVNFVVGTVNTCADKQKELAFVSMAATAVNIGLNFLMIPIFQRLHGNGAIGAMIATLITELCVMVMNIYLLPRETFVKTNLVVVAKSVGAGVIAGLFLWYLEGILNVWYLSGIVAVSTYVTILVTTNVLSRQEWNMLVGFLTTQRTTITPYHIT
jgi:O-antigen/teichoic acid export membrane protein